MSMRLREELEAYLFLLPWILGFLVFLAGPLVASLYISLTNYNILQPPQLVGFANFGTMFTEDQLFLKSLRVTAVYTFVSVPLVVVSGYLVALLLNQNVRGLSVWRTIFYLPAVVSGVAVAQMPALSTVFCGQWVSRDRVGSPTRTGLWAP